MTPYLRITIKEPVWPYLWVKFPRGFSPNECCARCLVGRFWPAIPWVKRAAGDVLEGEVLFAAGEEWAYLCGVSRTRVEPAFSAASASATSVVPEMRPDAGAAPT